MCENVLNISIKIDNGKPESICAEDWYFASMSAQAAAKKGRKITVILNGCEVELHNHPKLKYPKVLEVEWPVFVGNIAAGVIMKQEAAIYEKQQLDPPY